MTHILNLLNIVKILKLDQIFRVNNPRKKNGSLIVLRSDSRCLLSAYVLSGDF